MEKTEKIGQDKVYELITGKEISWQAILYDLINTEQLDPWDVDLVLLSKKYLEKIRELEEANFFITSKVLLAASLLLRIKSEMLLNRYIRSIDDILFGKKEETRILEKIEIDENEVPELIPKTPLPRFKKVSLQELMGALDKAISTETRRIRKEIQEKQAEREAEVVFPKVNRVNVRDRIRKLYARIKTCFKKTHKISYTELAGKSAEERIFCFLPVLHLDNQEKIWLNQENHFEEIWIWMKSEWKKEQEARDALIEEVGGMKQELDSEQKKRIEKINQDFENPLADFFDNIE
jgi:segregation and condensation protein A